MTAAKKVCSSLGFLIPHNSDVGTLGEIRIELLGQDFTQFPHKLQSADDSIVRTN